MLRNIVGCSLLLANCTTAGIAAADPLTGMISICRAGHGTVELMDHKTINVPRDSEFTTNANYTVGAGHDTEYLTVKTLADAAIGPKPAMCTKVRAQLVENNTGRAPDSKQHPLTAAFSLEGATLTARLLERFQ